MKQKINMGALMAQVQKVQADAQRVQEEIAATIFEGTSGGGAVSIKISGSYEVKAVTISPEVVEAGDREMLEDLVRAALDEALSRIGEKTKQALQATMGGAGIPGIPGLF